MCKYCKRLKELNELDKKEYEGIIAEWKRRDLLARNIILHLMCELEEPSLDYDDYRGRLIIKACDFLDCDYVGK